MKKTPMTASHLKLISAAIGLGLLAGCATPQRPAAMNPDPRLPTEQYALTAAPTEQVFHLRINPNGLSENQGRALDQVAAQAGWTAGSPAEVIIITNGEPASVASGHNVASYLSQRDVPGQNIRTTSRPEQPYDIITVSVVRYQAVVHDCNRTWENLSRSALNKPYANFGCALTSNMAAQVADPRDLTGPVPMTPADASRRAVILDKYRKGEVTAADKDGNVSGNISQAIK